MAERKADFQIMALGKRMFVGTRSGDGSEYEKPLLFPTEEESGLRRKKRPRRTVYKFSVGVPVVIVFGLFVLYWSSTFTASTAKCDSISSGYQCSTSTSHNWGQYSPFFSVPGDIDNNTPAQCNITFVQILSRHGARNPTATKSAAYAAVIEQIHSNVETYKGAYSFLADYRYALGADHLTTFGQQEMVNSGMKFYGRYGALAQSQAPFIRASAEQRVIESATNFTQGFNLAKMADGMADPSFPYDMVLLSEESGSNNTLNHGLCTNFEGSTIAGSAQATWANIFAVPIQTRLNKNLIGANLTLTQTIYMMDLCPFDTVASTAGKISHFCNLFTALEWEQYSYFESLNKWYGYLHGNPLGPTQGVGFTNELIARMTNTPVVDETTTNHTLDGNNATFPIGTGQVMFADFSHDNDMTAIFGAMGLYSATKHLTNTSMEDTIATHGYSAAYTVPFAARAYFEKMTCLDSSEELVRVVVNDRVLPLETCRGDELGRCKLKDWVASLSFARDNGLWKQCFT